jgi:hypothetical protein
MKQKGSRQAAARAIKDASKITQTPQYLAWVAKSDKEFNSEPNPLKPGLGEARQKKADELRSGEKIDRDTKRLRSQGLNTSPEVLKGAARKAAATEVLTRGLMPLGVTGSYDHGKNRINIADDVMNKEKGKRTLRHEMEHAYDEAGNLSGIQAKALKKLGAADPGAREKGADKLGDARQYSPEHIRIGIMHIRDDAKKNFVDGEDLDGILKLEKGRKSRQYLERMMKANPGMSMDDIAKLTNQIAARKRAGNDRQA